MVKRFLKNGTSLLSRRQTSILSAASIIMMASFFSAILGFVRDRLLASQFGASSELGIFFLADNVPRFIFNLLITGSFAFVFIPVFTKQLQKNEKQAWAMANSAFNLMLGLFFIIVAIIFIFPQPIAKLLAANQLNHDQLALLIALIRVMLLSQLLLLMGSFMTGVLQSYHRFVSPAIALIFYNLGIILGIIFLVPSMGIFGPAVGMIIGAIMHILIQLPFMKEVGYRFSFKIDLHQPGMRELFVLMWPRILGQVAPEISRVLTSMLATTISLSSTVILNFSTHLAQMPITLFGIAIAQAAFPFLSSQAASGNLDEFKKTMIATIRQILFFILPISVALIVLKVPAVRLIFGASKFDWEATILTSWTVVYFAIGMFATALIQLLIRGFYALHDSRTPLFVGLISGAVYLFVAVVFIMYLNVPVWGLSLAFSLSSILQLVLLFALLDHKVKGFRLEELLFPSFKLVMASVISGGVMYTVFKALDRTAWDMQFSLGFLNLPVPLQYLVIDTTYTLNLVYFTAIVAISGGISYLVVCYYLRVKELSMLYKMSQKITKRVKKAPSL